MTQNRLIHIGAYAAVAAAVLILGSQVLGLLLPTDSALAAVETGVLFWVYAVLKLSGFVLLLLGLVSLYARQSATAGMVGFAAFLTAFTGTVLVAGDWWFEAFAAPWFLSIVPDIAATQGGDSLRLGAYVSYGTFTVGWFLFAAATFRARVFPRWIAVLLMVGALVAYVQGTPPFGAVLAIAVGMMGAAMFVLDRARGAVPDTGAPAAAIAH